MNIKLHEYKPIYSTFIFGAHIESLPVKDARLQAMEKTPGRHHRHGLVNNNVVVMTFNNYWTIVLEVQNIILKFKMMKLIYL